MKNPIKNESLFLYTAGIAADMVTAVVEPVVEPVVESETPVEELTEQKAVNSTEIDDALLDGLLDDPEESTNELLIIDSGLSVEQQQKFIDTAQESGKSFIVLDNEDTLESLVSELGTYSDLDAIHIISHGNTNQFDLAGEKINDSSILNFNSLTEAIKNGLNESGDLLLYGCNVASGDSNEFLETIASLTDADVAASDDLTGAEELGGDWDLEVEVGEIEADEIIVDGFDDVLAATGWNNYRSSSVNMGTIYSQYLNGDLTLRGGKASLDYNLNYSVHGQVNEGFIYLDTRTTISFSGTSDNASTVYVDGSAVILQARWGSFSTKRVTLDAGHHKLVHIWENDREEGYYHINVTGATVYREAPNNAPTAANIETTIDEDVPLTFTSSSFDGVFSDVETANAEGIRITSGPTEGKLFLSGTEITDFPATVSRANIANLTYENTVNENGDNYATFQFEVFDGTDYSDSSYNYVINVTAVNDAPILKVGSPADTGTATANETTLEDTELTMTASDYVLDVDGDLLTIKSSTAADGTINDNGDGTFSFDPNENFNGDTTAEVTFQDPDGEEVTVDIPIKVTAVNDAPEVDDNTISAVEDEAYIFELTDFAKNYSDVEGEFFSSVKIDSLPMGELRFEGNLVSIGDVITIIDLNNNKLTYEALENENGSNYSSFQFSVSDGIDYADTPSTMTIDVDGVNDAPILLVGSPADTGVATANETTNEDTALTLNAADYAFDVDGDLLTIKSETTAKGTITDHGDGTFTFNPEKDFNGPTSTVITFVDPFGEEVTVTIPLEVTPVNDAPVAVDDNQVTRENTITFDVLANDTDIENDSLSITRIISVNEGATAEIIDGKIRISTAEGYTGTVSVRYEISDGDKFSEADFNVNFDPDAPLPEEEEDDLDVVAKKSILKTEGLAVNLAQIQDGEYNDYDSNSLVTSNEYQPDINDGENVVATLQRSTFGDDSVNAISSELSTEIDKLLKEI